MNKNFKDTFDYICEIIGSAEFYANSEMTDFDITINPNGVDWGAYCSKPNNGGWWTEEDWVPEEGWPVYHLKTDNEDEIIAVVKKYLAEYPTEA